MRSSIARGLAACLALAWVSGCSLILDPDDCSGDGDCENGQTCQDGVCFGEPDTDHDPLRSDPAWHHRPRRATDEA